MRSLLLAQFAVALFLNAQEALSAGPTTCRSTMSPPIVLNSLKEIWNTIKLTSVSENREMLRKNLGELNSEYLKMLDAGEVWIELHGKKIANEIKTRKLSKIGGLDILVVGAGPHAANFAAGAMDIYRRRAQIDKNITPPKMLLVGKDGVAPSFRKYSSPLVSPVVWRRDYSMNYSMGQDPFPFPGSPFSTADLLGFIDSKNPPSPWHSHLASQHPQIPPTSEGGLVFLDSNRIYEQTVLTIAQAQVPFLDETSLVSFSWHDDMRLIEARTKNGISIFAKALVIATGPGSPIVPFDDQKSQRTFKLASEMFNSGQMRLSLGTSEDFYLALQREGPSFINQFRKEKSLIIGASDAGKALIETLFGALELRDGGRPLNEDLPDPTFVWDDQLAHSNKETSYPGEVHWVDPRPVNSEGFFKSLRYKAHALSERRYWQLKKSFISGSLHLGSLRTESIKQEIDGRYRVSFSDGSVEIFDNVISAAGYSHDIPDLIRTVSNQVKLLPFEAKISEKESLNNSKSVQVGMQVEIPYGANLMQLPVYLVGTSASHYMDFFSGGGRLEEFGPDSFAEIDRDGSSLNNLSFRSWAMGSKFVY